MAQQTQVTRVVPVFERFVERFPTPRSLADAPTDAVLSAWEDLGFLRRALTLRDAATRIAEEGWPRDPRGLAELPGVGPYTAAAVACFAFGHPVPAVDVNLRRVLSRWAGEALSPGAASRLASELIDREHPADWNQAVMDLSAARCRPRDPRCEACPVSSWCADPTVEVASRRQSTFEGSVRQARAALLKAIAADGPHRADGLAATLRLEEDQVARAVSDLVSEQILVEEAGIVRLADQS